MTTRTKTPRPATARNRLNDLQVLLLASAAQRAHGSLIPLPERCDHDTTHINKAIAALLKRHLVEEAPVTDPALAWREQGQEIIGLFITAAGRTAIGAQDVEEATPPRPVSKIATVKTLLQRQDGATLAELVEATGWLPHTTRAALTGLRKKGHALTKAKREGVTCYAMPAEVEGEVRVGAEG